MPDDLNDLKAKLFSYRKGETPTAPRESETNNGAQAGMELVGSILVGCGGGWALDRWLGTSPWLFLLGFCLGVAVGFYSLFRMSKNLSAPPASTALPTAQKTYKNPPAISDDDDD